MTMRCRSLPILLALAACQATPPPPTPSSRFYDLELRLLSAEHVEVEFEITAEGAYEAELRGLLVYHDAFTYLVAQGMFAGKPTRVEMVSTETEVRGGFDVAHILGPLPPALGEGILLGMTRMGLLHNLAVLTQNQMPDGVDGKMREWVQVEEMENADDGGLRFGLIVGGERAGRVSLKMTDGLPSHREQVVQFPNGEMRVVERYPRFTVRDSATPE